MQDHSLFYRNASAATSTVIRNFKNEELPAPVITMLCKLASARHNYHAKGGADTLMFPNNVNYDEINLCAITMSLDAMGKAYGIDDIRPGFDIADRITAIKEMGRDIHDHYCITRPERMEEKINRAVAAVESIDEDIISYLKTIDEKYNTELAPKGVWRENAIFVPIKEKLIKFNDNFYSETISQEARDAIQKKYNQKNFSKTKRKKIINKSVDNYIREANPSHREQIKKCLTSPEEDIEPIGFNRPSNDEKQEKMYDAVEVFNMKQKQNNERKHAITTIRDTYNRKHNDFR